MMEPPPVIRVFLAVSPPHALRPAFQEVRASFPSDSMFWRWVAPEQIHLTLKFLGDIPTASLTPIIQHVSQALAGQKAFAVQARTLGCFPQRSRPRLLWMGLHDPQGHLACLQHRIETALQPLGHAPDQRPFHPHLTLARASQAQREPSLAALLHRYHERCFGEFSVTQVHVFQSYLHRQGAVYTVLQNILLQS